MKNKEKYYTYGEYDDDGRYHVAICLDCDKMWEYWSEDELNRIKEEHDKKCTSPRSVTSMNTKERSE